MSHHEGRRPIRATAPDDRRADAEVGNDDLLDMLVADVEDYAILLLDADGNVATWNTGAQRLKGYRAEEIIGRHFSTFYPREDVAAGKPRRELETAAAEGRLEDEGWRVRRDGTRFWANVVITALRGPDGELRGYGKITRDLSERRVAELALRASDERFRRFLDEARIGMMIIALDGRYERVNDAFCAIVGYSREQLTGLSSESITHADDLAAHRAKLRALLAGGSASDTWEKRYLHASGNTVWASISIALINDAGRPLHFIAQVEDITERHNRMTREAADRKRAEELRQLNAEFGQHALATADLAQLKQQAVELVARTIEAPFVRLGELDDAGTMLVFSAGVGWPAHLIDDHSLPVAASECEQSVHSGQPVFLGHGADSDPLRPSHESRELGIVASATIPIRGKDAVAGVLHVGLREPRVFSQDDVTFLVGIGTIIGMVIDRDRREQRIKLLNVDLQQRYEELEAFSYSVAHDLRGPLRAVAGFAGILEEDYSSALDDEGLRFVGLITKGASDMGSLIDALLSLTRVSCLELVSGSVDLTATARSIIAELHAADPARNAIVTVQEGLIAEGDTALLRNVLANLLGNAWKFTRGLEPAVIRFESELRHGQTVYAVRDNGIGFSTAHSGDLFAPFKRLHGASFEGTGIGLATVARIVHRHGGQVWVESEPEAGATFYFTLSEGARAVSNYGVDKISA
jgi:PAS domain S-box-containing protein